MTESRQLQNTAGFLSFLEKIIILYRRYNVFSGREGLDKTKIEMPPYIRVRSLKSPIASLFLVSRQPSYTWSFPPALNQTKHRSIASSSCFTLSRKEGGGAESHFGIERGRRPRGSCSLVFHQGPAPAREQSVCKGRLRAVGLAPRHWLVQGRIHSH